MLTESVSRFAFRMMLGTPQTPRPSPDRGADGERARVRVQSV
jgi:hypothetical protein